MYSQERMGWAFIVCLFLFITNNAVVWAENSHPPRLTLNEAVRTALEQHPRLTQSRQRLLAAQAQTEQVTSVLFPQLKSVLNSTSGSARSNTSFQSGAIIENPNSNQLTAGIDLKQLIYDFGQSSYRIKSKAFTAEAREFEVQADRALTVFHVERVYFEALTRNQLVMIAEETVLERRLIKNLVEALYTGEKLSKIDLSLAEVEVKNAQLLRLQSRNDYKVAIQTLRNVMGLGGIGGYTLEDPRWTDSGFPSIEALMAKAREQRPELEAIRRQLKGSQAAVTSAKREFFPKIKALASTGQSAISDRNGKWWYGVFGSLSIPLFTGGRIENEIREAQAIQGEMEARMRELAQEVELQVAVAYHTHEALKEKGAVTRDQIAIARTALDLARERLRLGLGSIIEVTQAEVAVTRAETAHALARFGVLTATAALDYATGSGLPRYEETQ